MLHAASNIPFMLPDGTLTKLYISYVDEEKIYCILGALDACKFLPGIKEDDNPVIVVATLKQ